MKIKMTQSLAMRRDGMPFCMNAGEVYDVDKDTAYRYCTADRPIAELVDENDLNEMLGFSEPEKKPKAKKKPKVKQPEEEPPKDDQVEEDPPAEVVEESQDQPAESESEASSEPAANTPDAEDSDTGSEPAIEKTELHSLDLDEKIVELLIENGLKTIAEVKAVQRLQDLDKIGRVYAGQIKRALESPTKQD